MDKSKIGLYYKNVMSEIIGDEHGITPNQWEDLAKQTSPIISMLNNERKEGKVPYRDLPFDTQISQAVQDLAAKYEESCENLVILGIGGSALGNIALQTALNSYMYNIDEAQREGPRLFVFDNVDPQQFGSFLDWISDKLDKTIFNVISKSGRTSETASQFMIICDMLSEILGPDTLRDHIIATTDAKQGTLRTIVDEMKLPHLEVPDGVGGRFSVLSAVGLFGAAMCGVDIDLLLEGARDMDQRVSEEDFLQNPAAINAAIQHHFYNRNKNISVMMPYSYALKDLCDWYRQIWAESLGKEVNLKGEKVYVGPTPVKALGTTDQHSQVQLYREGPNDKLFTFLQVNNFDKDVEIGPAPDCTPELGFLAGKNLSVLLNSEKMATEYALLQSQRPCMTAHFDKVDAYSVGQFIYLYEVTTSFAGALFGINTYDQPAVELGKEATFALMEKSGDCKAVEMSYDKFAQEIKEKTEIDEKYLI
ncbi:MAG: glucose-6-phosphate isomerase [Sedimentisphaerales bacterium]|nr:glucose-6-phosphate isomerase [Sedimentisphaerales bacterium]